MSSSPVMRSRKEGRFSLEELGELRGTLFREFFVGICHAEIQSGDYVGIGGVNDDIPFDSPILSATWRADPMDWSKEVARMVGLRRVTGSRLDSRKINAERIARVDQAMRRLEAAAPMLGAIEEAKNTRR